MRKGKQPSPAHVKRVARRNCTPQRTAWWVPPEATETETETETDKRGTEGDREAERQRERQVEWTERDRV